MIEEIEFIEKFFRDLTCSLKTHNFTLHQTFILSCLKKDLNTLKMLQKMQIKRLDNQVFNSRSLEGYFVEIRTYSKRTTPYDYLLSHKKMRNSILIDECVEKNFNIVKGRKYVQQQVDSNILNSQDYIQDQVRNKQQDY
jgi:hypothetical protein